MNKKKIILNIFIIVVLISSGVLFFTNRSKDFSSFIAVGCTVEHYSQQQDNGYITIKLDSKKKATKKVVKVKDKELQKKLLHTYLPDIIGANMIMTIPSEKLKSNHININNLNGFDLLYNTNKYDKYIILEGISLK